MPTAHTADSVRRDSEGGRWLLLPEYGPIDAALGYGLFYLLVSIATDPITRGLTEVVTIEPGLVRTAFAISLWVMLGLVLLGQITRQLQTNPHRFTDARERQVFLDRVSPGAGHYLKAVGAALLGGAIVLAAWQEFLVSFGLVVVLLIDPGRLASLGVGRVLWLVSFFIGFAVFTYGIDRLVIGLVRSLIAESLSVAEPGESPA